MHSCPAPGWASDSTLAGNLNFLLSQEGRGSDLVRPGPTGLRLPQVRSQGPGGLLARGVAPRPGGGSVRGSQQAPCSPVEGTWFFPPCPVSILCPQLASQCQIHPLSESSPADRGTYMQNGAQYPRSSPWFPKQSKTRNQESNKGNRCICRFGLTCCSVKIHRKEEAKARKSAYADAPPIGGETHLP